MSRQEFDQLDPRRSAELWEERVRRINLLSEEQKEVLFAYDPDLDKLSEMPVDEMEALAGALLEERRESADGA